MQNSGQHNSTEQVKKQLDTAYRSILSKRNRVVLLRALLILFTGLTALIIAEKVFYFSAVTKSLLLISLLSAAGFSYWREMKALQTEQFKQFYREFSRKSNLPELKDTLDLEKSGSGNRELIDAAILQNLGKIESVRLSETLSEYVKSSGDYNNHKRLLTLSIATLIIFSFTSFNFGEGTQRAFSFWKNYEKPNPFNFTVQPGDVTLEQGSPFRVDIEFHGNLIPEEVNLNIKTHVEEDFRTRVMEFSGNTYRSVSQDLNNDLQYYIEMDGYKSDLYTADVQLRPRFSRLQAAIKPPEYTELDSTVTSYPMSQLRAYEGSTVKLTGKLNKPVSWLQIYTEAELQDLSVRQDSSFSFELEVDEPDTLRFYMEDENSLTNRNSFQIIVVPQSDEYPIVEIIEPKQNLKEVNPEEINLLYRATDDFGFTAASLNYELKRAYVDEPLTGSISLDKPSQGSPEPFLWNLSEFDLKPQDILTFWVSVQDNDEYNGFKSSGSQKIILEVPSLVDYFDDLDEEENEVATDLDEISESFDQTRKLYDRFKQRMKDNPENTGYEEKRELEQVQKQQEEVQKKIDELNKKFEELKNEMSQNNILSEETQEAYQELQKLMEEIDDPAYREALKKLQEQLGQMNPEQLRQAMQELEFNEELYKERLQRTIELFKKLKLNSDLDKLVKAFEDMARKEGEIAQSDVAEQTEQSKEQKQQLLEENEQLKKQVDSLSENVTPKNQRSIGEYQENTKNELDQLSEDMKEEIEGSDENSGENQHQNRQEKYHQLAENTKSMMQNMNRNQMNINIAGLRYVLHSLLNLSLEQEDLTTLASATENRSQAYVNYARNQRNVEEIFKSISDSLFELSSEIPQFSNQINKKKLEVSDRLERSLEQMSERNRSQSSIASRQALGGINDISFMVVNLLEQLQNSQNGGQGGSGMSMQQMMEQLGETGKQQQQLNQRLQEMINDIQGERLSQDQMERLNQIARQQNEIRKQLQELQRSGDFDGDKIGSELERMIEDMEDTINDLRGGAADPVLIERQQNILSRMLEAEQAMQERDEEDKREGSVADDFDRSTPPELTLEELEKQIRTRLNDPNFTKYSPDYQRLIENYFELLKQLQEREIQ